MNSEDSGIAQDFRRIYQRAAGVKAARPAPAPALAHPCASASDGLGEALFGADTLDMAAEAVRRGAIKGDAKAAFYFEFPFTGEPRMDLLMQYGLCDLRPPVEFAHGDAFGFQPFFDACARDKTLADYICGFSFDLSAWAKAAHPAPAHTLAHPCASAGLETPGIYLLPPSGRENVDYVPNMLARLGASSRIPGVMAAFSDAPSTWQPYYAGFMPGRPGAPTRLGFSLTNESVSRYAKDPEALIREIERYYRTPFSREGREVLSFIAKTRGVWDLQFDLYPDDTFGDGLGVTVSFSRDADPRDSAGFMEKGSTGELMRCLESRGLADARWRLMDKACCGFKRIVRETGVRKRVGDMVRLNAVKVRFKKGAAFLAKGYLFARTQYL